MTEVLIGTGDAVSQLLQAQARGVGLRRVWSGNGANDAKAVLVDLANALMLKDAAWRGLQELYTMPELKELPEAVQVKLMAIILNRKACTELEIKK